MARSRNYQKSRIDGRYPSEVIKWVNGRMPSTEFDEGDIVNISDYPAIAFELKNPGFEIRICEKYAHIEVVRLGETAHAALYWH